MSFQPIVQSLRSACGSIDGDTASIDSHRSRAHQATNLMDSLGVHQVIAPLWIELALKWVVEWDCHSKGFLVSWDWHDLWDLLWVIDIRWNDSVGLLFLSLVLLQGLQEVKVGSEETSNQYSKESAGVCVFLVVMLCLEISSSRENWSFFWDSK
jgi:hypothetical protein